MSTKQHFCLGVLTSAADSEISVAIVLWRVRENVLTFLVIDPDINLKTAF